MATRGGLPKSRLGAYEHEDPWSMTEVIAPPPRMTYGTRNDGWAIDDVEMIHRYQNQHHVEH